MLRSRCVCWWIAAMLSAALLTPETLAARPTLDKELPAYAIDVAACKAFAKGGSGTIEYDPFKIQGVQPETDLQITATLVPDSPIFHFYGAFFHIFSMHTLAFYPGMRCFANTTPDQDGKLRFTGIPDGDYVIFTSTAWTIPTGGVTHEGSMSYTPFGIVMVDNSIATAGKGRQGNTYVGLVSLHNKKVTGTDQRNVYGAKK